MARKKYYGKSSKSRKQQLARARLATSNTITGRMDCNTIINIMNKNIMYNTLIINYIDNACSRNSSYSETNSTTETSVPLNYSYIQDGSRVISLSCLGEYIATINQHSLLCNANIHFLGEINRNGLASTLVSKCCKCQLMLSFETSKKVHINTSSQFEVNIGATLGQIATGGGGSHLEEQLSACDIPSMHTETFVILERKLGILLEEEVTTQLIQAGKEEEEQAIQKGKYHQGVPAISVVVDCGWSKRSHKHSYNANSGVGVIFGAETKRLLYVGVRNKYCSVCSIAKRKGVQPKEHHCFCNWSGTSCGMEPDIITEGFCCSESMHGLRYMWLIGDGDSSALHAITTLVPYGRDVKKVECSNHAVKCYRTRLENIYKDNPSFRGKGGLTKQLLNEEMDPDIALVITVCVDLVSVSM